MAELIPVQMWQARALVLVTQRMRALSPETLARAGIAGSGGARLLKDEPDGGPWAS